MIGTLKIITPIIFYFIGIMFIFVSFSGKVRWTILFITFLLPLQNIIDKLQQFPFGKDYIDILLIAMTFGWVVDAAQYKRKTFEKSPINTIAIVLMCYIYLSLWNGYLYLHYFAPFDLSDPRLKSCKNFLILPFLYFLTFNNIHDKKWVWRTFAMMCLSMVFMNYYLLRQIEMFSTITSRDKIHGTFVDLGPNEIAAFYNQYSMILLSIIFFMKNNLKKILLFILFCVNIFCVAFLFSRGAYLGLVAGLFFLFAIKRKVLLIPLILALLAWQTVLPANVKARIEMTTNAQGELDPSAQGRIIIWEQSISLFKSQPIFGVGYAVFRELGYGLGDTHNIYLKILTEQGVIGFIIFLVLIGTLFREGWKLFKRGDDDMSKALGLGFAACIIVLLVNNLFGNRWTHPVLSSYFWIIAGLVARCNVLADQSNKEQHPNRKKRERSPRLYGRI